MALYIYLPEQKINLQQRLIQYSSYLLLLVGAVLLFWAYYPIVWFEIYSRLFIARKVISPIPDSLKVSALEKAETVLGSTDVFSNNLRDFVNVNVWFPSKPQKLVVTQLNVKQYTISIPKLNIIDAKVVVGGDDLSKSMIHYLPQSLPGEYGNVAIFCHSSLPQLYNVKDYKTICTYLPSLDKGDKILVKVSDVDYVYEVYDMFIVRPDQVSVLDQKLDDAYLTLITCVPPGTFWNRLVVRARLSR